MEAKTVLISGAGIGGLTLAYFLRQHGFSPVVIEKSESRRDNGYMIDFFSSGISVSQKMGIMEDLEKKDIPFNVIRQLTDKGRKSMKLDMTRFRKTLKGKIFNFLRTDLADVLYNKVKDDVEIRFGQSISEIHQDNSGVEVTFQNGEKERFDLLIGADGLNSNVRRLSYPDSEVEKKFLGYYVCALEHRIPLNVNRAEALSLICPKRQIMSYETDQGVSNSLFAFKSPLRKHMSTQEEIEVLKQEFGTFVSPVPEIIEEAAKRERLFFDQVSQIRLRSAWHKGRVALVGDAAYCITLLSGQGASMAMTGAYVLAEKLRQHPGDWEKAFTEFESDLRPKIEKMQRKAVKNAASYLPSTKFTLWLRNRLAPILFSRLFAPLVIRQLGAGNYFAEKK